MRALRFARNPCAIHSANCRAADCTVDRIAEIDASDSIVSNGVSSDASSNVSNSASNDAVVALALGNAGSIRGTT